MALRAVKASDKPAVKRAAARSSVSEAAASGDHRALLVAMRERIASAVSSPDCPPRDLASLTLRLQNLAKEIEGLDLRAKQEGGKGDRAADEAFDASAV